MLNVRQYAPRIPAIWPSLAVCAVAAILIDLGTFHRGQHSDTLNFIHISLYRWTPFFWESDRVGSVVPLLAIPFRNPLANLLVQNALYIWSTLAAFVLLAAVSASRLKARDPIAALSTDGTSATGARLTLMPSALSAFAACRASRLACWLACALLGGAQTTLRITPPS